MKRATQEQEATVIEAYRSGLSAKASAAKANLSERTCFAILDRNGIQKRSMSEAKRRYAVNEAFFSEDLNHVSAYWLGFLHADGNLCGNTLTLRLKVGDALHVESFKKALRAEQPIEYGTAKLKNKRFPYCQIRITSKTLAQVLEHRGIVPNKSHRRALPRVPVELRQHFWRGVFGGDGTIAHGKKWVVSLVGTKQTTQSFAAFLCKATGVHKTPKKSKGCFRVAYGGVALPQLVVRELYTGEVALLRKARLAEKLLNAPFQVETRFSRRYISNILRRAETYSVC